MSVVNLLCKRYLELFVFFILLMRDPFYTEVTIFKNLIGGIVEFWLKYSNSVHSASLGE